MDYKAKYEEALERARALHDEAIAKGYALDYVKDYEAIFPELAESEDERIRKQILKTMKASREYSSFWSDEEIAWVEKQKEQKPAEWSEKDEKVIADSHEQLIRFANSWERGGYPDNADAVRKIASKLKSLRPQPKQTDEDKSISEEILEYFNKKKDYRSCWYVWVKYASRNPHWKPSEEQMNELHGALIPGRGYDCDVLQGLYADLKKLMED